jgi:chromosome partition protein MukB
MTRARATTLVLVNWKGVFYEKYDLDDHVTALEGDNGAGKTTVMIAAYVVLLPDMGRLRFTNVGEGDPTGGDRGVHGRLGHPGRPSYAFVAFRLPKGRRLVAGVRLEAKGEPSVELTPLLLEGIADDVELADLFLLRMEGVDRVPELDELRQNVARVGGRLTVFKSAKEYFATLFEHGITPLRLVTDEERSRFNDLLRTSMTGGLSRALTSGFRTFLLKEESGLADMLIRMRNNLEACRRTRLEVRQSRQLEREIHGVFEAGDAMFAAAMHATKERALECQRRVETATGERDAYARAHEQQREGLESAKRRHDGAIAALERAQAQLGEARRWHGRVLEAHAIDKRRAEAEGALGELRPQLQLAGSARQAAADERERRRVATRQALDAQRRAADGLAALQTGLEELHRRAYEHRAVQRHLEEARTILERPQLDPSEVDAAREHAGSEIEAVDRERSELAMRIADAARHRGEHAEAMAALRTILGSTPSVDEAHAQAREALARIAAWRTTAAQEHVVVEQLRDAEQRAVLQRTARERAAVLATDAAPLASSADVRAALSTAEAKLLALLDDLQTQTLRRAELSGAEQAVRARIDVLDGDSAVWREIDAAARRLEQSLDASVRSRSELHAARSVLEERRSAHEQIARDTAAARDCAQQEAAALERAGGAHHADLLTAAETVGGELVAAFFEDVPLDQAGPMEANLGPLASAIVVGDVRGAADLLRGRDRELDTIWLVEGPTVERLLSREVASVEGGDLVVEEAHATRLTRIPEHPTLGRRARSRRIASLRAHAESLRAQIEAAESELHRVDRLREDADFLLAQVHALESGDPASRHASAVAEAAALEREIAATLERIDELTGSRSSMTATVDALRDLLPVASLLDEPDLTAQCEQLQAAVEACRQAQRELARTHEAASVLGRLLDALVRAPVDERDVEPIQARVSVLAARRRALYLAIDALAYVADHRAALAWTDAAHELARKEGLVPALQRQHDQATENAASEQRRLDEADAALERSGKAFDGLDAQRILHETARDREQLALDDTGIDDPSESAVKRAEQAVRQLEQTIVDATSQERSLFGEVAVGTERLEQRAKELADAETKLETEIKEWRPSQQSWDRLRDAAETDGLVTASLSERLLRTGQGSPNLRTEARSQAKLLEERLGGATGGAEILQRVQAWLHGDDQATGDAFRQAWVVVRDWLRRRIPAQIAEVDDPLDGLRRLQRQLASLEEQLERQEAELRGTSQDVARAIDVHIRRAQGQVRRLNQELTDVRFGTIAGIEIALQRNDRLAGVLEAFRGGSAQELLFGQAMPLEEALDELLRRHGGGRSRGEKLLDYREYLDVAVNVRRQGHDQWERVNPAKLSTGEAIGVGAALMMVVLTAWERSANLLRAKRGVGTLRLLFLDEANRLSKDNLAVLFDLCENLDLQLLIAAPEVAQARGCTTYRLVRRVLENGEAEVLVSGRRSTAVA